MEIIYHLRLLGTIQVEKEGVSMRDFESRKTLALLGYLARHDQPVSRSHLADLFWGDKAEGRGRRNLSHELSLLSSRLPGCFQADYHSIQFQPTAAYWVDTRAFEELIQSRATLQARSGPAREGRVNQLHSSIPNTSVETEIQPAKLAEAVTLYRGDFMAGYYLDDCPEFETWVLREQELWRRQVTEVLDRLIAHHTQRGQDEQAQFYVRRWLALEPWQEEAHQQLMLLLARTGQRGAALAQYEICRRFLAEELAVEPAAETVALYEQIRTGELSRREAPSVSPPQDWGEAPEIDVFYGRQAELAELEQWLVADRCRLVAVLGMGGVGKTALAAKLIHELADQFEYVIWRSLLNAPPFAEILRGCLQFLSAQQITDLPESLDERLALLLDQLRQHRCLIVLDNVEGILQGGDRAGYYRPDYEAYGQLIQRVGEAKHQSCLLLTSRERPSEFTRLERDTALVRSLPLAGLGADVGQEILQARGLSGSTEARAALVERYSGNPLALKLVSETIHELFEGDIAAFLREETLVFDDIRDVLDQQFARLSELEREIMVWLAIEREAISAQALWDNLAPRRPESRRAFLEAMRSLQRRSLVEKSSDGFTLQNVVIEYTTDRLIAQVCQEIETGILDLFNSHALLKAQAKEYVRQSQTRLILQPIAERLVGRLGRVEVETKLKHVLTRLRMEAPLTPSYAGGNILNLLLHLRYDVQGYDFSRLTVWQANLQGMALPKVNFTQANLTGSIFTDTFSFVNSVALSPDGQFLAGGTGGGEIRLWQVADGQPVGVFKGHTNSIWSIAFSPDGFILASGSADHLVRLWDTRTGQILHTLHGHTDWVRSVAFSPDGFILASGSMDYLVRLWDTRTGQVLHTLHGHTHAVLSIAFSPDGFILASGSADYLVRLWDTRTGQTLHTLHGHTNWVRSVAFSPDGFILASGSADYLVRLWDTRTGQVLHTLHGHTHPIWSVAFSPNEHLVASGSDDRTIRLWDTRTGQVLHTLHGHTNWVRSVAFNPNGETLATSSADETIRLWNVQTGACLKTLRGEGPYAGMNITGATGLTQAQKVALKALGAVEEESDSKR